jgi:hypothetical protein
MVDEAHHDGSRVHGPFIGQLGWRRSVCSAPNVFGVLLCAGTGGRTSEVHCAEGARPNVSSRMTSRAGQAVTWACWRKHARVDARV